MCVIVGVEVRVGCVVEVAVGRIDKVNSGGYVQVGVLTSMECRVTVGDGSTWMVLD